MALIDLARSTASVPRQAVRGRRAGSVTVAAIVDDRHEAVFGGNVSLLRLASRDWRADLLAARPDVLVVASSVTRGPWRRRLVRGWHPHAQLEALVTTARDLGITTVFWNVDDPAGYDAAVVTARLFDHVLTVDADRVPWYRVDLEHHRIGVLRAGGVPEADFWKRLVS